VYVELVSVLIGLVGLLKPLRFLGMRRRRTGGIVAVSGLVVAIIGALLPAGIHRTNMPESRIDDALPAYHFHEVHSARIHASPN